uniref:Suf domain-containing protein n=1 Tax=Rodentolepis nana TaxID=102285 RepID=A0A158QHI6_RODNA
LQNLSPPLLQHYVNELEIETGRVSEQLINCLAEREELRLFRETLDRFVVLHNALQHRRRKAAEAVLANATRSTLTHLKPQLSHSVLYRRMPRATSPCSLVELNDFSVRGDADDSLGGSTVSLNLCPPEVIERMPKGAHIGDPIDFPSLRSAFSKLSGLIGGHSTVQEKRNEETVKLASRVVADDANTRQLGDSKAAKRLVESAKRSGSKLPPIDLPWPMGRPEYSQSLKLQIPIPFSKLSNWLPPRLPVINEILLAVLQESPDLERLQRDLIQFDPLLEAQRLQLTSKHLSKSGFESAHVDSMQILYSSNDNISAGDAAARKTVSFDWRGTKEPFKDLAAKRNGIVKNSQATQVIKARNYDRVAKLFQKCLVKVLNIDLWKLYLQYVKDSKCKLPNFREKMAQAYDFTLDKMGLDLSSYSIWADYITYLKSTQVQGTYAESQKITATRKVYQRAIVTPMLGIETIWRDYCMYEDSINPHIAKKLTEERGRDYMTARNVTKEYEIMTKGLSKNIPSVPPQNTPHEVKQVELWKRYIQWEKDNPLKTEDISVLTKRVLFAYEQCLLCLGHHPDIWYEAASYLEQASKLLTSKGEQTMALVFADDAAAMYERALNLLKNNMMLYFAYADYEEGRCKYVKVHSIYKKLISLEGVDPTLPYIQYMRFARRCEGVLSARLVFKSARADPRVGYQAYVCAAMMEYFCSKDMNIGHKIFELGMKHFSSNADFVLCYVDFMSHLNEDNNTRVLYERALGSDQIAPERTRSIWSRFLQFELQVGDLGSVQKIEKRRLKSIETVKEFQGRETALLIDRYRFLDLYPCSESELRSLGYRDLAKLNVTGSGGGFLLSVGPGGGYVDDTAAGVGGGGGIGGPSLPDSTDPLSTNTAAAGLNGTKAGTQQPTFPRPDFSQMLPFKPKAFPRTNSHPVEGGEFPPPPAASDLLRRLPPPECFRGPFVQMDKFLEHFLELEIPADYIAQVMAESEETGLTHIDPGTALSIELSNTLPQQILMAARKRKQQQSRDDAGGSLLKLRRATTHPSTSGVTTTTNVFGDSEDEGGSNDGQDDDNEDSFFNEETDADVTAGGVLDLFKFRVSKKQASN